MQIGILDLDMIKMQIAAFDEVPTWTLATLSLLAERNIVISAALAFCLFIGLMMHWHLAVLVWFSAAALRLLVPILCKLALGTVEVQCFFFFFWRTQSSASRLQDPPYPRPIGHVKTNTMLEMEKGDAWLNVIILLIG